MLTYSLNTLFTGQKRIDFDTVSSTNSYLSDLQKTDRLPEGTIVTARFQASGKGQYGNGWESAKGENLLLSFLWYPQFVELHQAHYLNMAFAVAVSDLAVDLLQQEVSIKWPNDIYFGNKKLGGMLMENVLGQDKIKQAILGIGMNVNQVQFSPLLPNPISLKNITGNHFDLESLKNGLCNFLEQRYLQLRKGDFLAIREIYHQRLYRHGKWEWFEAYGRKFKGMIMGVNRDGQLMIQEESGHSSVHDMKQIRYLING